jgi:transcriptional regulator with XRE-family HTH domain
MSTLKHLRTSRGLRLKDVASQMGTDTGNLSRIEAGKQAPSIHLARKLAAFYSVTLEEVFSGVIDERAA